MRTLEEKIAARKAEREELYRLDAVLREEAIERRKAVEMTRRLIEECTAKANERTARMMIDKRSR